MQSKEIEHEIKFKPRRTTQIKLLSSLKEDSIDGVIETISSALGITGAYSLQPTDAEAITDVYHDTDDLCIFKENGCLRVRHSGKDIQITVKLNRGHVNGEFTRDEISMNCDQTTLQQHIRENFVEITRKALPHLSGQKLRPKIVVKNSRRLFSMQSQQGILNEESFKAKLSFDMFTYVNPVSHQSSDEMYELEIEALNEEANSRLNGIGNNIRKLIRDFEPSTESKYEHGVKFFHLDQSPFNKRFFNWSSGPGLNWLSLWIGLVGIILTILGLYLTIK